MDLVTIIDVILDLVNLVVDERRARRFSQCSLRIKRLYMLLRGHDGRYSKADSEGLKARTIGRKRNGALWIQRISRVEEKSGENSRHPVAGNGL